RPPRASRPKRRHSRASPDRTPPARCQHPDPVLSRLSEVIRVSLTISTASTFARIALGHVGREYPHKLDHVLHGDLDLLSPRELHPIFFGSFDWHSCVHGYWLLAHLYRRFPDLPEAAEIRAVVDSRFTKDNVAGEVAYLERPSSGTFERPYGWAW